MHHRTLAYERTSKNMSKVLKLICTSIDSGYEWKRTALLTPLLLNYYLLLYTYQELENDTQSVTYERCKIKARAVGGSVAVVAASTVSTQLIELSLDTLRDRYLYQTLVLFTSYRQENKKKYTTRVSISTKNICPTRNLEQPRIISQNLESQVPTCNSESFRSFFEFLFLWKSK